MPRLTTQDLTEGQTLAEDVFNFQGQKVLPKGVQLTSRQITALKAWAVEFVVVESDDARGTPEPVAVKPAPVLDAAATEALAGSFRLNDLTHPAVRELFRLAAHRAALIAAKGAAEAGREGPPR